MSKQGAAEVVAVLGGGPAGATASMLLASWGHSVRVLTRPQGDQHLAVSLPPSCAKLFKIIGVGDAIERAHFIRSTGNTVWWGGAEPRLERFAEGERGWQVDLGHLSQLLLECAIDKGVDVDRRRAPPAVDAEGTMVLDCSGRAGVVARAQRVRRYPTGARTIALVGEWERPDGWPVPDDSHTLVESYVDGWMWSVPAAGARHIAAMVDPQRTDLARGGSSTDVYLGEIGKTREFKRLTAGAKLRRGARGWDASQYDATSYSGEGWLLVGDAGSFIDPLSSAGVKKALASAWLAAITVHTCLTSPSMTRHAMSFFDSREREIVGDLFREQQRFLAAAASGHQHAFWEERVDRPPATGDRLEVMRAFAALKDADRLSVTAGPGVAIEARPCIRGNAIVLEPHVVAGDTEGTRYVQNIDMVTLIELAPQAVSVPGLHDLYAKRAGAAPLDAFLGALSTAVSRRWLVAK